jgi:nitroimidazol reductase NimA-like FMN-containing flavoprotein (pyridoxamine 5'-phosphate oxidase superfamily)
MRRSIERAIAQAAGRTMRRESDTSHDGDLELGMEALPLDDCERRLARGGVGILALAGADAPVVRPVNFALHRGSIWIRTGEGRILAAGRSGERASFVLTEIDRFEHAGWSVVVTGKLAERLEPDEELKVRPWAGGERQHFVSLAIDRMSGRRIATAAEAW